MALIGRHPLGIAGIANFRDVGGCPIRDGRHVRRGVLYRSTELSRLAGDDLACFAGLGIRRVYDLRTEAERRLLRDVLPAETRLVVIDVLADAPGAGPADLMAVLADAAAARAMLGGGRSDAFFEHKYRELVTLPSARAGFGRLFRELADHRHRPALIHCTTGKDRTGWAAASLQMLLGVPDALVLEDYLLSNELLGPSTAEWLAELAARGGDPELLRPLTEVREAYLRAGIDEMESRYGTLEAYFSRGLGVDDSAQEALREAFLEA